MRLLLIEDSQRLRTSLAKALTRLGHAVDVAEDGEKGDIFAGIHRYEVIVLDLMLSKQSGLQLLEKWRRRGKDTPIIILTALNGVEDRVHGLALGADDYLTKPFAIAERGGCGYLFAAAKTCARRRRPTHPNAPRTRLRSRTGMISIRRRMTLLVCAGIALLLLVGGVAMFWTIRAVLTA